MLEYAQEVASFVHRRTYEEYESERMLRRAVERCVLVIGEAANRISGEFRGAHPAVPWQAIVVRRHRLVHDYDEFVDEKIWAIARVHVPVLMDWLRWVLPTPPPDPLPEGQDA